MASTGFIISVRWALLILLIIKQDLCSPTQQTSSEKKAFQNLLLQNAASGVQIPILLSMKLS